MVAHDRGSAPWLRGFFGSSAEEANGFYGEFTPSVNVKYPPNMLRPSQAMTIAEGNRLHVDDLLSKVYQFTQSFDTWEFKALPIRMSESMVDRITATITELTLLQQTVEGLTPQLIELKEEQHAVKKKHWQQGYEMKGEYFMTPGGQREARLKHAALKNNVVATMAVQIKKAIISYPFYWQQHQKTQGMVYPRFEDALRQEINMFGVVSNHAKGIYGAINHMKRWTRGDHRAPLDGFDMAIVASGQLEKAVYDVDKTWNTEAYRSGTNHAQKMITGGADAMKSHVRKMIPNIYEDIVRKATNKPLTDVDFFKQRHISSAHFVIQADKLGAPDGRGFREPAVQAMALPKNEWHTFTLSEALDNDIRFDSHGNLDEEKYQSYMRNLQKVLERYDFSDGSVPDPFLWRKRDLIVGGKDKLAKDPSNYAVCQCLGDREESIHSLRDDEAVAVSMAQNDGLTMEEQHLLDEFLMAVESVRDVPAGIANGLATKKAELATEAAKGFADGSTHLDSEWGGLKFSYIREVGLAGWDTSKPYGYGTVANMMSLLKSLQTEAGGDGKFAGWEYKHLIGKYTQLKNMFDKMWDYIKRVSPTNDMASVRYVPIASTPAFRDLQKNERVADNARRAAVLGSFLTGTRFPTFVATEEDASANGVSLQMARAVQAVFGIGDDQKAFYNVVAQTEPEEILRAAAVADQIDELFAKWLSNSRRDALTLKEFTQVEAASGKLDASSSKSLIMVVGYLLTMLGTVDSDGNYDERAFLQFSNALLAKFGDDYDRHHRVADQTVTQMYQMLPLHFAGRNWRNSDLSETFGPGKTFFAADAENAGRALDARTVGQISGDDAKFESGKFARSRFERTALGGYDASTAKSSRANRASFAYQKGDQFISASAGHQPGGPFVATDDADISDEGRPKIYSRRNMIQRFDNIKHAFRDARKRLYGFVYLTSRISKDQNMALIQNGIPSFLGAIGSNPFVQLIMDMLLLMKSGTDTGFLAHNYGNSNFGQDPGHKELKFNLTLWMAAVIINGANIAILPGAGYAGYRGGLNIDAIKNVEAFKRMGRRREELERGASMLWFSVPASYSRSKMLEQANPCPLSGQVDEKAIGYRVDQTHAAARKKKQPFPGHSFYDHYWKLSEFNANRPYQANSYDALRRTQNVPMLSMHRKVREYNDKSGQWDIAYSGSAHIDNAGTVDLQQTLSGEVTFGQKAAHAEEAVTVRV